MKTFAATLLLSVVACGVVRADIKSGSLDVGTLDGSNGFTVRGVAGGAIANAGDVNGDGLADIIVGDPRNTITTGGFVGYVDVIYGARSRGAEVDAGSLPSSSGYRIQQEQVNDFLGNAVGGGFDFNADGRDDIIFGAPLNDVSSLSDAGSGYIVFGQPTNTTPPQLSTLPSTRGMILRGSQTSGRVGGAVNYAGDINGDGVDDVLFGRDSNGNGQQAYVVFGTRTPPANNKITGQSLNGNNGFVLQSSASHTLGVDVARAGDVNGDGIDDLMIGGDRKAYVVFGKRTAFGLTVNLDILNGSDGFVVYDPRSSPGFDWLGRSVSAGGDVNNDGIDDIIVADPAEDRDGVNSGSVYVIYGRRDGFSPSLDVSRLDGSNGFVVLGTSESSFGTSVSAMDFNNDGFSDIIAGASNQSVTFQNSGAAYVIYGHPSDGVSSFKVTDINGSNGFRIFSRSFASVGGSVRGLGDVNGDGWNDLGIGASGREFIIYGIPEPNSLILLSFAALLAFGCGRRTILANSSSMTIPDGRRASDS
jgi:hypothetical protein